MKRSAPMKRTQIRRKEPTGDRLEHPKAREVTEKACKNCGHVFPVNPRHPLIGHCSYRCGLALNKSREKAERENTKARKEAIKTIPVLLREAQVEFSRWVRARDAGQPCISCGKPEKDPSQLHAGRDAGHYRSVGSAGHLRFHADNCHAQCVHCNQWGAGRAVDYRIGLIARIGTQRVEALESDNTPRKWTREELLWIKSEYRAKRRELEKARA